MTQTAAQLKRALSACIAHTEQDQHPHMDLLPNETRLETRTELRRLFRAEGRRSNTFVLDGQLYIFLYPKNYKATP